MLDSLSLRAYTSLICSHEHDFHQVVLPLHGVIEINVNSLPGVVGVGQIVIIQKGTKHSFQAQQESRFLVADLTDLPNNASSLDSPFASISPAMQAFCIFVETQLQYQINDDLALSMVMLFKQLLLTQEFSAKADSRITRVIAYIDTHLDEKCSLEELAIIANLSVSHFKTEFKKQMSISAGEYIMGRRMEKARALLNYTDYPIQIIAEQIGYDNVSAFSRRFSKYFGNPPSKFKCHK